MKRVDENRCINSIFEFHDGIIIEEEGIDIESIS